MAMTDENHAIPGGKTAAFHRELVDTIRGLLLGNAKALALLEFLHNDPEVRTIITHGNTLVVGRLNYNDHGLTHSLICSINALSILDLLKKAGIPSTLETEHWGDHGDAQMVVLGGAYLHDIGNAVHREGHHIHSPYLANDLLREPLNDIYGSDKAHRVRASILECIFSHDESVQCLSIEAGCVTVHQGGRHRGGEGTAREDRRDDDGIRGRVPDTGHPGKEAKYFRYRAVYRGCWQGGR